MMSLDATAPILVVESDRQLGQAIVEQLIADGFKVELARSAEHARMLADASAPKLAVLGRLDSPSGALELLREIRRPGRPGTAWDASVARDRDRHRSTGAGHAAGVRSRS